MKYTLLAFALLVPGIATAYPNPNVSATLSAGEIVESVWTQPKPTPLVLAENAALPVVDQ